MSIHITSGNQVRTRELKKACEMQRGRRGRKLSVNWDVTNFCLSRHERTIETRETHVAPNQQERHGLLHFRMSRESTKSQLPKIIEGMFPFQMEHAIAHF